jgi:hypothetical protein
MGGNAVSYIKGSRCCGVQEGARWMLMIVTGPSLLLYLRAFMAERCLREPDSPSCCALASKWKERGLTAFTFRFLNLELRTT